MTKKMEMVFLSGKMAILIMEVFVTMLEKDRAKCCGKMEVATKANGRQVCPMV